MDGTVGPRAEKCAALAERLKEATGLPVVLWDERRTTVDAHRILGEQGVRSKNRKDKIDSVAATLILGGMLGGEKPASPIETNPGITDEFIAPEFEDDAPIVEVPGDADPSAQLLEELAQLRLENTELQAQLDQQKQQVANLQADLMALKGGDTSISAPSGGDAEQGDTYAEAYNIFNQIKKAYADFDRAKLEELIPQMDQRVNYLSGEDLNEYYLILEYVEQPSNG
jgi:hypothetical protein